MNMQYENSYEYEFNFRQLKLKRLTKVSVGRDVEEIELSSIAGRNGNEKALGKTDNFFKS